MAEKRIISNNGSSIVLYTTDDGNTQLEVKFGGSKWFDDSFNSSIGQIYQTFGSEDLYPSVEKRLPCSSFGSWKKMNGIYGSNGHKHITDNTLVALTLMITESRTEKKDIMVKVVVNLINKDNQ